MVIHFETENIECIQKNNSAKSRRSFHPCCLHYEWVARLEGAYPHLAKKADLQAMQATLIMWIVGAGIAILIAIIAVLQWFFPMA